MLRRVDQAAVARENAVAVEVPVRRWGEQTGSRRSVDVEGERESAGRRAKRRRGEDGIDGDVVAALLNGDLAQDAAVFGKNDDAIGIVREARGRT